MRSHDWTGPSVFTVTLGSNPNRMGGGPPSRFAIEPVEAYRGAGAELYAIYLR